MGESYELALSASKGKREVHEDHFYSTVHDEIDTKEKECCCSKMCALAVVTVIIFTLLTLAITACVIFHIRDSGRMEKIEADISELQDQYKQTTAEVIANSSHLIQNVEKNWVCNEKSCYYFGFEKLDWFKAQEKCRQRGAALIEIDSATENEFLFSHGDKLCYTKSDTYQGTESTTAYGIPCQRWDSHTPHNHTFRGDQFPEGNLFIASNYCRDPDREGNPWCYTVNPHRRWDFCNVPKCEDFWIGATDIEKEGTWKWTESNRLLSMSSYTNWRKGEPNNEGHCNATEDCAMFSALFFNGKWNDVCCDINIPYLCKRKILNE